MSNWLGVATVTGALGARIRAHLSEAGLAFDVTLTHPADADTEGVFVHLYSVLPNAALRNDSLPDRSPDGTVLVPPKLALDLYYQITFVGAPASLDVERMAGAVMTGLHAHPRFAPDEIRDFVAAQPAGSTLSASDLADQVEQVRITPLSSDVEELSRLWGMSQRNFHRLSVLYRVSSVVLEPDVPTTSPLPVTDRVVTVSQLRQPRVASVTSSARDVAVVEFGEVVVVAGEALRGSVTEVVLGEQRRSPATGTDVELRVPFDAASTLRAGVYALQVRHRIELPGGQLRDGAASNTMPVALVTRVPTAGLTVDAIPHPDPANPDQILRVHLLPEPLPDASQSIELSLTSTADGVRRTSTDSQPDGADGVLFQFTPPPPSGTYLVRLTVDGAESLLVQDGAGNFVAPAAVVP